MRVTTGEAANERADAASRLQWLQSCVSTEARLAVSAAGALVAALVKVLRFVALQSTNALVLASSLRWSPKSDFCGCVRASK